MKHLLLLCFFVFIFGWNFHSSQAFLGDEFSLNMYENIDEGINDLEETLYKKALRTDRSGNTIDIGEKISEVAFIDNDLTYSGTGSEVNCYIDKELSSTDIENVERGRLDKLFEALNEECKGEDDDLSLEFFLGNYVNRTSELSRESKRLAKGQAKAISEISRVGIYSDGNEQNSPFDLIVDLQDINNIIFSKEIPYLGVLPGGNLDEDGLSNQHVDAIENVGENFEFDGLSLGVLANAQGDDSLLDLAPGSDGHNLVCQSSSENSGLSEEALAALEGSGSNRPKPIPTSDFISSYDSETTGSGNLIDNVEYPENTYVKMKDNDRWPCTEFFCIRVEFTTENYNLLVGGKTKSIESLLKVSNEHLKKFANTSLVQSKMTTNNFEISWRDLNLPDLFHSGVQVQFVPPPILNLDQVAGDTTKEKNHIGDDFKLNNLLTTYFKYYNLDYEKQNSLQRFNEISEERKTILTAQDLSINKAIEENNENFEKLLSEAKEEKILFARSLLDKKVNSSDSEDFYLQFAEIERFSAGVKDYTFVVSALIQKMKEIPIHNNG